MPWRDDVRPAEKFSRENQTLRKKVAESKGSLGIKIAGRACWIVAGTLCSGVRQETAAQKSEACISCDFYALVIDEENGDKITLLS